jgi:hypothetical protein
MRARKPPGHLHKVEAVRKGSHERASFTRHVPMIKPLPVSSLARLTLLPGEPSTRSRLGSLSPTLTKTGAEAWKERRPAAQRVTGNSVRAAANMVNATGLVGIVYVQAYSVR